MLSTPVRDEPKKGGTRRCPQGETESARFRLEHFEQASSTHAAADAHGDDHVLHTAALAFDQGVAGHAGTGHTVGVADGDGAAVDIVFFRVDAELVPAVQALACLLYTSDAADE